MLKIIAPQAVFTACPFCVLFCRPKRYISSYSLYYMRISARFFSTLLPVLLATCVSGQRLPFESFNVERGLSQSQVTAITQDKRHYLWIGTFGGLNRFDGTTFKTFSKQDGINSNHISCLYTARKGDIWIGTARGISYYNGHRFINLRNPAQFKNSRIAVISEDENGTIYALDRQNGLLVVEGDSIVSLASAVQEKSITCLFKNKEGKLLTYRYKSGFYQLINKTLVKLFETPELEEHEYVRLLTQRQKIYYAVTNLGRILKIEAGKVTGSVYFPSHRFIAVNTSQNGDVWLGATQGALVLNSVDLSVKKQINATHGLSDNLVYTIYKDVDHTLWLGTDGDGIIKYTSGAFTRYDKNTGLPGNLVMGFAPDARGDVLVGIREGGLVRYDPVKRRFQALDYSRFSQLGVNCLGSDEKGNVYLSTLDNQLLKVTGNRISSIRLEKRFLPSVYTLKSYNNRILVHTAQGGYWLNGDSVHKIPGVQSLINSFMTAEGSLIMGNEEGVSLLLPDGTIRKGPAELSDISVSCLEQWREYIVIASLNEGLFFWDRSTGKIYSCNSSNGLKDNNVFAVMRDTQGNLWVGTSSGIQQVSFDQERKQFSVKQFSIPDGYESAETNLNALIENKGSVWVGTTRGLYIYNPSAEQWRTHGKPVTVIEKVAYSKLANRLPQLSAWEHLPIHPRIVYANNNISFQFKGIYPADPASLLYTHYLEGYDTGFSPLQKHTFLSYNNLPPGQYVFKVKAIGLRGAVSDVYEYPFTIVTPFYKTFWFALLAVFTLIGLGVLIQALYAREKRKRRWQIKQIKEKEQQTIREQTAEDFHDELGNKLTRISVLAEVLQNKTDPADEEKRNLINQIRSNALGLYTGTRQIIWSLAKESDNLKDVLITLRETGVDLFSDTPVTFSFTGLENISDDITIPTGYSRHVVMIFKELMSNSMRHARANQVVMDCRREPANNITIFFADNGIGFDKNTGGGNGLNNIRRRAEKIDGIFRIHSIPGLGSSFSLSFTIKEPKKPAKKRYL